MAIIESGVTSDLLTVDPTSKAARTTLYTSDGVELGLVGGFTSNTVTRGIISAGLNDGAVRLNRTDRLGSTAIATVNPLLIESFEGNSLATNRWASTATTMAAAQTTLGLTLNSGSITTVTTGYLYTSLKRFVRPMRAPIHFKTRARLNHVTNSVIEFGFGLPATFNGATPVGAYWQVTSAGVVQPVLTFNGIDITGTAASLPGGWQSNYYTWDVILDDDEAIFIIQDTSTNSIVYEKSIKLPLTQGRLWDITHLPVYYRLYNTGVAPATAPQVIVTDAFVGLLDTVTNKSWNLTAAQMGMGSQYNPLAFTQIENNTNSTAPTNATLSNTTAGYAALGGLFSFAAVAGAATDYCLFGFQIQAPYQFVCTGIDIDTYNTVVAVATTPTVFNWSVSVNGSTVSLADGACRRRSLGSQSLLVGAGVGQMANTISRRFDESPIVCEAGRFFDIVLRMPIGTATATEVFQGQITVHGFFE